VAAASAESLRHNPFGAGVWGFLVSRILVDLRIELDVGAGEVRASLKKAFEPQRRVFTRTFSKALN
jgi:hypothetical protein